MMPVIAYDLLESIDPAGARASSISRAAACDGIEANGEKTAALAEQSLAMATALTPEIGHDRAAAIAKEARRHRSHGS